MARVFRHWYSEGMTRQPLVGPATAYIAGELRAQQARKGWTLDEIADLTGVGRSTVNRALKGQSALAIEALIPLCLGMGLDAGRLLDEASKVR